MYVYRNRRYEEEIVMLKFIEKEKKKYGNHSVWPALGYWVKEGVGLVVHIPLEDVAKINTP